MLNLDKLTFKKVLIILAKSKKKCFEQTEEGKYFKVKAEQK
jgi:hypothetical protein